MGFPRKAPVVCLLYVARAAGGRCADRTGQQLNIDSGSLIVANDRLFDQLREVVAWQKRD